MPERTEDVDVGVGVGAGAGGAAAAGSETARREAARASRTGVLYGIAAYGWWGLVAVYFKAVAHVPAVEVLAHRTIWSFVLLLGLARARGRLAEARAPLRDRRTRLLLATTAALIAANWLVFIWAVANRRLVEASLGYFINPLVNVLLGRVFLAEKLRPAQAASVALAAAGVSYLTWSAGALPAISLTLAVTFGLYGLLRKKAQVAGAAGLLVETALLLPLALGYLAWLGVEGRIAFGAVSRGTDLLLIAGGIVTALPLIWFVEAARRLRLVTVGFLQYIAPTLQLLLGVVAFGEPFTAAHRVAFPFIWAALTVFSIDAALALRRR